MAGLNLTYRKAKGILNIKSPISQLREETDRFWRDRHLSLEQRDGYHDPAKFRNRTAISTRPVYNTTVLNRLRANHK